MNFAQPRDRMIVTVARP